MTPMTIQERLEGIWKAIQNSILRTNRIADDHQRASERFSDYQDLNQEMAEAYLDLMQKLFEAERREIAKRLTLKETYDLLALENGLPLVCSRNDGIRDPEDGFVVYGEPELTPLDPSDVEREWTSNWEDSDD